MEGELLQRLNEYLQNGGYFNPDLMDHEKVRDLLVDCRNLLWHQAQSNLSQFGK